MEKHGVNTITSAAILVVAIFMLLGISQIQGDGMENTLFFDTDMFKNISSKSAQEVTLETNFIKSFAIDTAKQISQDKTLSSRESAERFQTACKSKGIEANVLTLDNELFGEQHVINTVQINGRTYYVDTILSRYSDDYLLSEKNLSNIVNVFK